MAGLNRADDGGLPRRPPSRGRVDGSRRRTCAWAIAALAAGIAASAARADAGERLDAFVAEFAAIPGFSARFREERHLALLQEPLVSRGTIYFAPPGRLLRRVEEPVRSDVLVDGGRVVFAGSGSRQTIDLDGNPVARAFVDTFRLLLSGDLAALRGLYRVELEEIGDASDPSWRLRLRPRHPPLVEVIESIDFTGRGRTPREFRLRKIRGDETVTRFSDVDTDRRFPEGELVELFGRAQP